MLQLCAVTLLSLWTVPKSLSIPNRLFVHARAASATGAPVMTPKGRLFCLSSCMSFTQCAADWGSCHNAAFTVGLLPASPASRTSLRAEAERLVHLALPLCKTAQLQQCQLHT